ncbi:MAG: 6-phosphogluconolactonase [Nanoarchaeota archaeon]|nr:6-phosphogluconolactonase [Nanoarchaeota archaeon]
MITHDLKEAILTIRKTVASEVLKKEYATIGLPGGRSVKVLLDALQNEELPWKKIHFFMVDERLAPLTSEDSNFKMLKSVFFEGLISSGKLPQKNLHPFDPENQTPQEYSATLVDFGGRFDVAVLGVGEDGHVGALFPNYSIESKEEYFFTIDNSPKLPKERMTSSRSLLTKSQLGVLLFIGDGKRTALSQFKDTNVTVSNCPAKLALEMQSYVAYTDIR